MAADEDLPACRVRAGVRTGTRAGGRTRTGAKTRIRTGTRTRAVVRSKDKSRGRGKDKRKGKGKSVVLKNGVSDKCIVTVLVDSRIVGSTTCGGNISGQHIHRSAFASAVDAQEPKPFPRETG